MCGPAVCPEKNAESRKFTEKLGSLSYTRSQSDKTFSALVFLPIRTKRKFVDNGNVNNQPTKQTNILH